MRRKSGFFSGIIETEIECRWPERFINLCAQNGIVYSGLRKTENGTLTAEMHIGAYRRLRALSGGAGMTVRAVKKRGAPFLLWRLRGRWALWAGAAACILAVWASSFFILDISVSGNENVPSGRILAELEELGVGIGAMRLSVHSEYISNELLLKIPELSWAAVNCNGSRAEVLVREAVPRPEIYDRNSPADIVAGKTGIITGLVVLEGMRVKNVGDAVMKGETVVSGTMTSLSSGERNVRALAEVTARTRYTLSACTPLETAVKCPTGRKCTKTAVIFAGKRINLYFSGRNPYEHCDKIILEKKASLPGGALPLSLVRETYSEYTPERLALDRAEAEKMLRLRLHESLEERLGDGEILSESFTASERDGVLTVTLTADCSEEIGETKEFSTGGA